jgi:hypothetical protein
VPHRCLQILEDDDFGFADASPLAMLQHLQATHGLTPRKFTGNLSQRSRIRKTGPKHHWNEHFLTRPVAFALVVDDFAAQHTNQDDDNHLITALEKMRVCSTDWDAKRCCALSLNWDCKACTCKISMPGYVDRACQVFHT